MAFGLAAPTITRCRLFFKLDCGIRRWFGYDDIGNSHATGRLAIRVRSVNILLNPVAAPNDSQISLSVFFPCYNEEANVVRTTEEAIKACRQFCSDFEVIIVNDGSKDRTAERADELAAKYEEVRAVHNHPNLGYGGALQRGFAEATKEWIFYTDGDGQFDFQEIGKLIPLLGDCDIVSAYRLDRKDSALRKLNAWCWTTLVNMVFGLWLKDIDCAFKIFPRRLFEQIELQSVGALIDTEVLAKAKYLGYRIAQVGVHHYPRTAGEQTGANIGVSLRAFKELFKLRSHIRKTVTPNKR